MPDHLALAPPSSVPHQVVDCPQVVEAPVPILVLLTTTRKPKPTVVPVVQAAEGPVVVVAAGAVQLLPFGVSGIVLEPTNKVAVVEALLIVLLLPVPLLVTI